MSPHALAVFLGLAVQTIYNRHSSGGDLPKTIKLGNRLRFRPGDVDAWLDTKRQSLTVRTPMPTPGQPSHPRECRRSSMGAQTAARRSQ
ncbi:helix-turn-helix transcriptional regulator [Burkholderia vietnamiensis]|uniref:helix-turn-helix transcriptional regulator n=1 Tax=Burkholderia vietnamiensis TaxID=60552 RepID=UPI0020130CD4|nr:helix-turn-helix domain-containing protein [Burkholderia vietnamiensis]